MGQTTEFLVNIRRIIKLHESMLKDICQEYELTLAEATIISFLHNNPGKDTAADIVELRMLQKGNVSQAVESLYQKGYLGRRQDENDRRKNHLSLTAQARPIIEMLEQIHTEFDAEIFAGISGPERETFASVNARIGNNIQNAMKGREQRNE